MLGPSYCWRFGCKHYGGVFEKIDGDEDSQVHVCDAYPEGIPDQITSGQELHSGELPGDHGIQFERDETLSADDLHDRMFGDIPKEVG